METALDTIHSRIKDSLSLDKPVYVGEFRLDRDVATVSTATMHTL
ncbi:MAG: hypothetical protein ABIC95_00540 [archaeon]